MYYHDKDMRAEKRLWAMVIIEAINDLDSSEVLVVRDENNKIMKDAEGKRVTITVSEDARLFLSDNDGRLSAICGLLGRDAKVIAQELGQLGPQAFKQKFLTLLKGK